MNRFGDSLNESLRMRVYELVPSRETKQQNVKRLYLCLEVWFTSSVGIVSRPKIQLSDEIGCFSQPISVQDLATTKIGQVSNYFTVRYSYKRVQQVKFKTADHLMTNTKTFFFFKVITLKQKTNIKSKTNSRGKLLG